MDWFQRLRWDDFMLFFVTQHEHGGCLDGWTFENICKHGAVCSGSSVVVGCRPDDLTTTGKEPGPESVRPHP
ncbi:hypothetical protein EYF80_062078 [Liparis tanakae]|uniref:Uncharacterized protein n=1 Tax=Liparis tanakae TaxID=230148 RepID=A0A4Z2EGB9_9TELE|nr:hypothetical protein EYF80_062078 [Liparis tanakae]